MLEIIVILNSGVARCQDFCAPLSSQWDSRQRRRGKYLLTKFVREGTYIDVVEREVPKSLDITDLEYYTLPPCANIQMTLCE
jgi:hypothetical protein